MLCQVFLPEPALRSYSKHYNLLIASPGQTQSKSIPTSGKLRSGMNVETNYRVRLTEINQQFLARKWVISVVLIVCIIRIGWTHPTERTPDLLAHYLKIAPLDTNYLRAADQYVWWLIHPLDQWARADSLLGRMEILARRLNDPLGLQRAYSYHGYLCIRLLDKNKALAYFKEAHELVVRYRQGPSEQQRVLTGMGYACFNLNQYETALHYCLTAIALTEKYALTNYITRAYIVTGRIMEAMNRPAERLLYWQKAYALSPREQDKSMLWFAEFYMAECFKCPK